MENLIQQLKDNEKPFGLISEEMQEKAREIECGEFFEYYAGNTAWYQAQAGAFATRTAYRLRPDYEDEPPAEVTISRVTLEAIIEIAQKALDK